MYSVCMEWMETKSFFLQRLDFMALLRFWKPCVFRGMNTKFYVQKRISNDFCCFFFSISFTMQICNVGVRKSINAKWVRNGNCSQSDGINRHGFMVPFIILKVSLKLKTMFIFQKSQSSVCTALINVNEYTCKLFKIHYFHHERKLYL